MKKIPEKAEIVSFNSTNLPFLPVKTSLMKNGCDKNF